MSHVTINRRPIKGFIGDIGLIRKLNQDVIDEMDGSLDWLANAFYAAKDRMALEVRNVTALKYGARSAMREHRLSDAKRLTTKYHEAVYDLETARSNMMQCKARYSNVRTIIFAAKSVVALCDSLNKEAK